MNVRILGVCAAALVLLVSGCSTQKNTGKYYDRDGPPKEWETFGMSRADAVPKVEKPDRCDQSALHGDGKEICADDR